MSRDRSPWPRQLAADGQNERPTGDVGSVGFNVAVHDSVHSHSDIRCLPIERWAKGSRCATAYIPTRGFIARCRVHPFNQNPTAAVREFYYEGSGGRCIDQEFRLSRAGVRDGCRNALKIAARSPSWPPPQVLRLPRENKRAASEFPSREHSRCVPGSIWLQTRSQLW
jgi:hypothetical protein